MPSGGSNKEDQKKFNDLLKEQDLIKEEHKSNIRELNIKVEELELQLKLKSDKALELTRMLSGKDSDI